MQEIADPALSLNCAREIWQKHGRSEKWIQQRMTGHDCRDAGGTSPGMGEGRIMQEQLSRATQGAVAEETRNKLTDYWSNHDIKQGEEFAILTNIIHQEWTGLNVKDHKQIKGLKSQNLRDHMSEAELIFTALAELSTRQIAETDDATGLDENKTAAKTGRSIAKNARKELEEKTGNKVISQSNYLPPKDKKQIKKGKGANK